ncbi:MAG TPA: O-antigen ligase family protein [Thermoanaerobaculia bacterium]|nr:O-antigen ligase family protein [Thermoanaerobaculia bacterium]
MERLSLRILQIGAIAVVLASSTYTAFELDRFFVPKDLALHAAAALAGLLAIGAIRRLTFTWVDALLLAYLGLSAISALFATNHWLAMRAFFLSVSAVVIFWTARALREAGLEQSVLAGIALAVVVAAATSLLQAYGVHLHVFSTSRAPGGTLGNRNFVAHVCAFGIPLLLLTGIRAKRNSGYLMTCVGIAIVTAALVLSRSRAGWLAMAVALLAFFVFGRMHVRLLGTIIAVIAGAAFALLVPNALRWRSENPYLESMKGVANYEEGSGRGRIVQYERSLRIAGMHPLFGVGPGNWPVEYPRSVRGDDPSLNDSEPGTTFNPWPSSDWVAFATERGFLAVLALAVALLGIAFSRDATLLAVLAAAVVAGLFDAVLLLAAPAYLVFAALGALMPSGDRVSGFGIRDFVIVLLIVLSALGAGRSTAQLISMGIYSTRSDRASLERAARIDPGNYRLQLRLARFGKRDERCAHGRAAHELFPAAQAGRAVSCGRD